jgi:hypothetical protein
LMMASRGESESTSSRASSSRRGDFSPKRGICFYN